MGTSRANLQPPGDLTVRDERPEDEEAVRRVHRAAFGRPAESELVDRLRSAGKAAVSLVAELDGQVVGHVLFSPVVVQSPSSEISGLGLAPVAVLPEMQRRGIGSALITAGIESCLRLGCSYLVVLGDPAYYQRFGFERASSFGLRNEYGADEEFRVVLLRLDGIPSGGGLVRYASEFAELDV